MSVQETFVKRPISMAVQAAIYSMLLATSVQASPTGGQVVGGSGSISQSGATTTINQASQNMAINWQSYNVNSNETVQYKQPNTSSISLNRILSNDGSTIAGHINANGQVILVNPNGILFTPTAVINVGGIIASGMDISPDNFMNGKYIFNEVNGKNGTVVNTGTINASLGGNVALIGKKVENDGLIAAKLGTVSLAAGKQAVLTFDNGGVLGVRVSKAILQKDIGVDPAILNKGKINAAGGKVLLTASTSQDVFSQAVNSGNIQQATSVVVNADGSFTLGSGANTVNTGSIDTSAKGGSQNGGQIVMLGKNVTNSGWLKADAADGNGGNIELHSTDTTLLNQNSVTSARSENTGTGGIVKVLGHKVGLFDQSIVDVSGVNGGGQALFGGDEHGDNANIQNASETIVNPGASIYADGIDNGCGGKVIVWSDLGTYFAGSIYVRGGKHSGDGGFVETSGKSLLTFLGTADRTAINGVNGLLLLDPRDITIANGGSNADANKLPDINFTDCTGGGCNPATDDFTIRASDLKDAIRGGDVTLDALRDIYIDATVDVRSNGVTYKNSLTMNAGDDVVINNRINLDAGNLYITSGTSLCGTSCESGGNPDLPGHSIALYAPIYTNGTITLNSGDNIALDDNIGGASYLPTSINIFAGNDITSSSTGDITANGKVTLISADASLYPGTTQKPTLTVAGDINLSGTVATNGGTFTATAGDSTSNVGSFVSTSSIDAKSNGGAIDITTYGNNGTYGQYYGSITGGIFTANAYNGQINQNIFIAPALNISGNATINAYGGSIKLTNTSNNVGGVVSLSTTQGTTANPSASNAITFANAATTTKLGDVSSSGPLTIYVTNDLELTKNVAINDINATSLGTLTFGASTNNPGSTFTLDTGVSLTNTNTAAGSLTVTGGVSNDTFSLGSLFNGTLNGGGGADTLIAPDAGPNNQNSWTITGSNTNGASGGKGTLFAATTAAPSAPLAGTIAFNDFVSLKGGGGADAFSVTGDTTGAMILDGGGGADTLTFGTALTSPIDVSISNTSPAVAVSSATNTFRTYQIGKIINNNTTVTNTLTGPNTYSTWYIQGSPYVSWISNGGYTVNFSGFTTIQGGSNGNAFDIRGNEPWAITAGINGDTFNIYSDYNITGSSLTGNTGVDTFVIKTSGNSTTTLNGVADTNGNLNDTLIGPDSTTQNVWTVNAVGGGTLASTDSSTATPTTGTVQFSNMDTLQGGNGSSTDIGNQFTISAGSINKIIGGNGQNTLVGENSASTWNITSANKGNVALTSFLSTPYVGHFSQIQNLTGGSAADDFYIGKNGSLTGGTAGLDGGTGNNTLYGSDNATNWYITGTNVGNLASSGNTVINGFSQIQNLVGGVGVDNFYFSTASATSSDGALVAVGGTSPGTIDGGTGAGLNSIYARSVENIWTFTGPNSGTIATVAVPNTSYVKFSDIQHFNAGTPGADWADLSHLGAVTKSVSDFNNFAGVIGDGSNTVLTGDVNTNSTWTIEPVLDKNTTLTDGHNDGVVTEAGGQALKFVNVSQIVGSGATNGNVNNNFLIGLGTNGTYGYIDSILGGSVATNGSGQVTNTLQGPDIATNWTVNTIGTTQSRLKYNNNALTTGFDNIQNLDGGSATDTFNIATFFNGSIDGDVNKKGQAADVLKGSSGVLAWTINANNAGKITNSANNNTMSFRDISYIYGNTSSSSNSNTFTVNGTGSLTNPSTALPGIIYGGDGTNTIKLSLTGGQMAYVGYAGAANEVDIPNSTSVSSAILAYSLSKSITKENGASVNVQQLNYSGGNASNFLFDYFLPTASGTVNSVNTDQSVDTLTINGASGNAMNLQAGQFQVGSYTPVTYTNVTNLTANAVSGESINLQSDFDLGAGVLTLENGAVSQTGGTLISANSLNLDNIGANTAFNTNVSNLSVTGSKNALTINQNPTAATAVPLTLAGLDTNQKLTINAGATVNSSASTVLTSSAPLNITSSSDINIAGNNQLSGEVSLSGVNVSLNNSGNLQLGNITATGDLTVTGSKNISQAAGTAIVDSAGLPTTKINTSNGAIALNNPNNSFGVLYVSGSDTISLNSNSTLYLGVLSAPNSVSLTTQGGIWNQVGGSMPNIQSNSVILSAKGGIGDGTVGYDSANQTITPTVNNTVNLDTSNLSAVNLSANASSHSVFITNDKNVTITDLRNNGDIYLNNTGDISLAVAPKVKTPNQGAIDANYGGNYDATSGRYTDSRYAGNVALVGTGTNSVYALEKGNAEADITAENLLALSFNQFGTKYYPVRLDVHGLFRLYAGTGSIAYPFGNKPTLKTDADLTIYSGINSLSGEQLIHIQSLGDVDPAIFTAVRNYDHEDVAILLPPDQRLGNDQECNSKDKKCKKRHQAMN